MLLKDLEVAASILEDLEDDAKKSHSFGFDGHAFDLLDSIVSRAREIKRLIELKG